MNNPLNSLARRLLIIAFVFLGGALARAQLTYTWDPTGTSTHTESTGTWDLASARWNNGTLDGQVWNNSASPANNAVIGWGSGSSGTPGTIKLNASVTVGNLTFAQTGTGSYAISQSAGGIALNGGTVTDNNTAASSTLTKVAFTIGSGLDFTKAGGGTLVLSSASFSGGTGNTHITGGTVILSGADNVLPTAGTLTVDSGGVFDMGGRLQQVAALAGAGTISNSVSSGKTFTISPSSGSSTFSGALGAATEADLLVAKSGAGTQVLTGHSAYTGATTVSAGALLDNGALAATAISVAASAEFGGTGSAGSTVLYQTSALGNFTITPNNVPANTTPFTVTGVMTCGSGLVMHLNVVPSNIALGNGTYTLVADTATPTGTFGTAVFDSGGLGTSGAGVVSISSKNVIYTVSGVTAGAIDHFAISAISSPQTEGTAITGITLTAEDVNNTIVPGFTGTVTYGGTAGITGTSGSFTAGQLTGVSVTPTAVGSSLTFTVTDGSSHNGSVTIGTINPGAVDHFAISAISSPQAAGTPITGITLTAQDVNNQTVTAFTGTVTYGGTAGVTGTSGSFVAGVLTPVSVTPTVAGNNLTFTVNDGSGHTGSATITTINGGSVTHFTISAISSPQTAGTAINSITLTALDANNNTANLFAGTVTYGGTAGVTGTSGSFTAGVLTPVSVTPTVAGNNLTFTVNDGSGHTGSATIATINPGAVSAGVSTASASPTGVPADGATTSTITVTLKDANGNPVSGKTVTLAQTGGSGASISAASGASTSLGVVTFTVTSTTTGSAAFTATDSSDSTQITQTASVNFTVVPSAANSTAAASPPTGVVADGSTTSTINVTVLDGSSSPIQGISVSAMSTGSGNTLSTPAATDVNGQTSFTIKSTKAETKTITVTAGGVQLTQQPTVQFVAGTPTAAQSTATANPTTGVTANGSATSTITVTLKDANGNTVDGKTVTVVSTGTGNTISSVMDTGGGIYTATISSTKAETKTITAADTSDSVTVSQQPTVQFVAGAVSAGASTASASPASVVATGSATSTITVTLLDANNNPVAGKTVTLAQTGGSGASISAASGTSTALGVVTFTVSSSTIGAAAFTATDTTDSTAITQTAGVNFTAFNTLTLTVNSNAVSPWTVPAGVTSVQVQSWGGGGAGGGALNNNTAFGGGGGGGGAYTLSTLSVTPGNTVAYLVGGGGVGVSGANGIAGTNTTFAGATTANGGGGGVAAATSTGGAASTGGTFNGGVGAAGTSTYGGGGGGSGGTAANGNPGSTSSGGSAVTGGGAGGGGATSSANGGLGTAGVPGGGGGGGFEHGTTARPGANGGNGQIVITYSVETPSFSNLANKSIYLNQTSIALSGKVSAAGPLYPAMNETVTASINGHAVSGTVTDTSGDFSINYNDASLATDPVNTYPITYSYGGDVSLGSASDNSTTLTVQPRPLPTLNAAYYNRVQNQSLKVKMSDLLANGSDADPLITLTLGYISPSTNGTALFDDGTYIYYTNSTPVNVNDAFQYYVMDGFGEDATNSVFISIIQTNGQQTPNPGITVSGDSVSVTFFGVPGYVYDVERNTNLGAGAGWVDITNVTTPDGGVFTITDWFNDIVPPGTSPPASAYYRLLVP